MNENLKQSLKSLAWQASGSAAVMGIQRVLALRANSQLLAFYSRLLDLGNIGNTGKAYLEVAAEAKFPLLFKLSEAVDRLYLPDHLNRLGWTAVGLLAAGSLLADWKTGDWVSGVAEEIAGRGHDRLAKTVKAGLRLLQLSLAGATALTPQIITKAMELKLTMGQLFDSWEGPVALAGVGSVLVMTLPVIIDGVIGGIQAHRGQQGIGEVILSTAKAAVEPVGRF